MESLTFTLLLAAIATSCFTLGPLAPFSAKAQAWAKQRLAILGTILVALGATPLVANQLEAMDLMNWLPPAFEWPSGFAPVASTPSGIHVVSLIPSARIQIYNRDWHFIRGWNVGTFGAGFYATPLAADHIEVAPEHGPRQYVFSLSGNLVAVENHPAIHSQILKTLTKAQYVPLVGGCSRFLNRFGQSPSGESEWACWASPGGRTSVRSKAAQRTRPPNGLKPPRLRFI